MHTDRLRADKLRDGKLDVDVAMVRRLIAAQFPQWAGLEVRPVEMDGWDNWTFHLGDRMKVRLPSAASYVEQAEMEAHWLPKLAPHLPQPIPVPVAVGRPGAGYPWPWAVYGWLDGKVAARERIGDMRQFAGDVAAFLVALQRIDASGGPAAGKRNFYRGGPLSVYDAETRRSLDVLGGTIDTKAAVAVWEAALAASWAGPPVWVHGDIAVGNLLVRDGRLSAVIDFGSSGVGDPACDLVIAWTFLKGESRAAFRSNAPSDAAMWARARGWALWKATLVLALDLATNPSDASARSVIEAVIAEHIG
jgi:aminoglycoside phosphotransferase (APT) family kinase protein